MSRQFSRDSVKLDFDVSVFFRNYNFNELLGWLQIIICHPSNQLFINRIEFLIGQLLAIPLKEFKGESVSRDQMISLFDGVKDSYDKLFKVYEDFEGFPLDKPIPLFFDNERYYFFYAALERPYEYYQSFIDRYFIDSLSMVPSFVQLRTIFTKSLSFQTRLIQKIITLGEQSNIPDKVYIPTKNYVQEVWPLFNEEKLEHTTASSFSIKPGELRDKSMQELVDASVEVKLFNRKLLVETNGVYVWLYPHVHLKVLMDMARVSVQEKDGPQILKENFGQNLRKACDQVFTIYNTVLNINSLNKSLPLTIEHCVFTDTNKLILFKLADYSWQVDHSKELTGALEVCGEFVSQLMKTNELVFTTTSGQSPKLKSSQLDIITILVFDPVTFNARAGLKKSKWEIGQLHFISLMDLIAIFGELNNEIDLIKFLKEENRIRESGRGYLGEYIERVAFYIQNGNTFLRTGKTFDSLFFSPHMWHDYYHTKLHKQFTNEHLYLELHKKVKSYYNEVEENEPGILRLTKTAMTNGAFLVSFPRFYLWIVLPDYSQQLSPVDFSLSYDLIGLLFKEHLTKNENSFSSLLSEVGFSSKRITIIMQPENRIKEGFWFFLSKHYVENESGIHAISFHNKVKNEIDTFIVFNGEKLAKQFESEVNNGERICLFSYFTSLFILAGFNVAAATVRSASKVDHMLPVGPKRYGAKMIDVENPKLSFYNNACSFNNADFGVVNRLVSSYLITNKITPGTYTENEAIRICGDLYKMLLSEIESLMKAYDHTLIPFAYKEAELGEGERYRSKLRLGLKAGASYDYDLNEQFGEEDKKFSVLTMTQRFLLQIAVKIAPRGSKIISEVDWAYFLALGKIANDISIAYENLIHNLHEDYLDISDDYILSIQNNKQNFDNNSYHARDIELTVRHYLYPDLAAEASTRQTSSPRKIAFVKHQDELNRAFQEDFGFLYDDLIYVLFAIKSSHFSKGDFFPVVQCNRDELTKMILFMDTQKTMESEYVNKILNFLSISQGVYMDNHMFLQSKLLKMKGRLLVSPLIRLNDETFIYASQLVYNALLNWSSLNKGIFLFELPDNSAVLKVIRAIHSDSDIILENQVFERIKEYLPESDIEFRIDNFKRLSRSFSSKPDCGEIDILCINRETKTVFVIEVKNVVKRPSNYSIKNNIQVFFTSNSSYYKKLLKKKTFVSEYIQEILLHFSIDDENGWRAKEVFVTSDLQFAAFYNYQKADFILADEIGNYLSKDHFAS